MTGPSHLAGYVASHPLLFVGIVLLMVLAYVTGANSVSESVATLVGGDVTGYRKALIWGSVWTFVGVLAAAALASALVSTFTTGLVQQGNHSGIGFVLAVLAGTIVWMAVATRFGLPVAATHALAGSLVIVGAVAFGIGDVKWVNLLEKIGIPIFISPFVAVGLTLLIVALLARVDGGVSTRYLTVGHAISSAAASFARGLNEGPKIASLGVLLLATAGRGSIGTAPFWLFGLVAVVMAAGSYVSGKRVTKTLAEKVTDMGHAEAFSANLVTAVLVSVASNLGLPVSNAEVGSGAITGAGIYERAKAVNWGLVRNMVVAWIVTAPAAGLFGLAVFKVLRLLPGVA